MLPDVEGPELLVSFDPGHRARIITDRTDGPQDHLRRRTMASASSPAAPKSHVAGSGAGTSWPKRPPLSSSGPAVKKSVPAGPAAALLPKRSAQRPSIERGTPFRSAKVSASTPLLLKA